MKYTTLKISDGILIGLAHLEINKGAVTFEECISNLIHSISNSSHARLILEAREIIREKGSPVQTGVCSVCNALTFNNRKCCCNGEI